MLIIVFYNYYIDVKCVLLDIFSVVVFFALFFTLYLFFSSAVYVFCRIFLLVPRITSLKCSPFFLENVIIITYTYFIFNRQYFQFIPCTYFSSSPDFLDSSPTPQSLIGQTLYKRFLSVEINLSNFCERGQNKNSCIVHASVSMRENGLIKVNVDIECWM